MPSFDNVMMADRKRPALDDTHNGAPPFKRQAVTVNGANTAAADDMPGKDDLDRYQKDAILRQMREYKREAQTLESRVVDLTKRASYHDEHLQVIDAWFAQLVDEVALLNNVSTPTQTPFETSLLTSAPEAFERHLANRSAEIKEAINKIYAGAPNATQPELRELQQRLAKLLAQEKAHTVELQDAIAEKERLSELLESASFRYMVAEKKLDRARSAQVAKLEAQAIATVKPEPSPDREDTKQVNGDSVDPTSAQAAEVAKKEALAVSAKRAEQIEQLAKENKKLTEQLTAAQMKVNNWTEEDYAGSELFKAIKVKYEEIVKKANDLEATNTKLREDIKIFQGERTSYREEADNELRQSMIEGESALARAETDLARIRHARDELMADLQKAKAQLEQDKVSASQANELHEGNLARISALEVEVKRLHSSENESSPILSELGLEELQARIKSVERDKTMLESEMKSMELAWKKASAAGSKKYQDTLDAEEKCSRLTAEKAKADQKYFGAMKAKELRDQEIRALKSQNAKSAEIISQLKDAEAGCRSLLQNLEKQLAEAKDSITTVTNHQRSAQQSFDEQRIANEKLTTQVEEMRKTVSSKDLAATKALASQREAEIRAAHLEVQCEESKRSIESWKKKAQGNQTEETEMLRTIALCTVCRRNFKNTVIKTCGHVFCVDCVEDRIKDRSRKCPNCGRSFGKEDYMHVTL